MWQIFEEVPPTGQDTVPTEYAQNSFGAFENKAEAEAKIAEIKKQPEYKDRAFYAREWPL